MDRCLSSSDARIHVVFCDHFASDYSAASVELDRNFPRQGQIATSGGVISGIGLGLSLIEEDWRRETSLLTARYLVLSLKRPAGQCQFSGFLVNEAKMRRICARHNYGSCRVPRSTPASRRIMSAACLAASRCTLTSQGWSDSRPSLRGYCRNARCRQPVNGRRS